MDLYFTPFPSSPPFLQAVVANRAGEIYELENYAAVGMDARREPCPLVNGGNGPDTPRQRTHAIAAKKADRVQSS